MDAYTKLKLAEYRNNAIVNEAAAIDAARKGHEALAKSYVANHDKWMKLYAELAR